MACSSSGIPPELAAAASVSDMTQTTSDPARSKGPTDTGADGDTIESAAATPHATSSIFSRSEAAPVHLVPMRVIRRPLPSELDEEKVQTFMAEMQVCSIYP